MLPSDLNVSVANDYFTGSSGYGCSPNNHKLILVQCRIPAKAMQRLQALNNQDFVVCFIAAPPFFQVLLQVIEMIVA